MEMLPLQNQVALWISSSRGFTFHAGLVLARSEALFIDPGLLPDEIDALSHRIPTSEDFASRVVLTHGHWDHVLGPERMTSVPTIAHESFPMRDDDPRRERIVTQVARWSNDQALTRSENFAALCRMKRSHPLTSSQSAVSRFSFCILRDTP